MIRVSTSGLLVVLLVAALGFAANGAPAGTFRHLPMMFAQTAPTVSSSASAETNTTLRPNEEAFLKDATVGARSIAELTRLGVSQAAKSDIRDLAQQMQGEYGQINNTLEGLARRKSVLLPISPTGFSSDYRELSARTGASFDQAYVQATAAASQRELRLFETAIANAKDAEIRDTAGNLLPVLRDHVNKLIELQKAM